MGFSHLPILLDSCETFVTGDCERKQQKDYLCGNKKASHIFYFCVKRMVEENNVQGLSRMFLETVSGSKRKYYYNFSLLLLRQQAVPIMPHPVSICSVLTFPSHVSNGIQRRKVELALKVSPLINILQASSLISMQIWFQCSLLMGLLLREW